ncbi:hypothetical protein J3F83DRAFT_594896 [Trichoderma novae-zelandiae]
MFGTMEAVATPEIRKKRPFQGEEAYSMDDEVPQKRRCEGFGVRSAGHGSAVGDDIGTDVTATTTQPGDGGPMATDDQSYFQISSEKQHQPEPQERRGRTRWREGSEPVGWDDANWSTPRNMVANFEDGAGAEQNPDPNSDTGAVKPDGGFHRA